MPPAADDLGALVADVEGRLDRAKDAAARLHGDLEAGRACDPADLETVSGFGEALRTVRAKAAEASEGEAEMPETLETLRELVKEMEEDRNRQEAGALIEALGKLAAMPEDEPGADLLVECKRAAESLLDPDALDDPDNLRLADGLACLVDLNEADDDAEKKALTKRASELLPPSCHAAVGLAFAGSLPIGAEAVDAAPVADSSVDGDVQVKSSPAMSQATPEQVSAPSHPKPPSGDRQASEPGSPPPEVPPVSSESPPAPDRSEVSDAQGDGEDPSDSDVVGALGVLVRRRQFGLAYWIASAWQGNQSLEKALKALAFADAMRSPVGESASRFHELMEELSPEELHGEKATQLIALVAGLRATLLAPYSGAPGLLDAVAASFSKPRALARLVDAVTTAGRRGLSAPDMTEQVQDIATAEDDLEAVQARGRQMLNLSTIKYQRASNVWRKWIEREGLLGSLLNVVIEDGTDQIDEVERQIFELRSAKALEKHLDETDRLLKSASRQRPIIADARQKLIERAEESLAVAADWIEVSRKLERIRQKLASESWKKDLLENLRTVARDARVEVTAAWDGWSEGKDLYAAAAAGTRPKIEEIFSLVVDGKNPAGAEEQVDEILGLDLLLVDGLDLDARLEPRGELRLRSLLSAVDSDDWESVFERRIEEANFSAAARIIEVLRRDAPERADTLERQRLERLRDELGHLQHRLDEAERDLEAARRQGLLSDHDGLALTSRLTALALEDDQQELHGVDAAVTDFLAELERAKQAGLESARQLYEKRLVDDERFQPHRGRFQRLLDQGEISTLEELVLTVERGEEPPKESSTLFKQLTEFFPAIASDPQVGKAGPEVNALAEAISGHGKFGALDFESLKDEEIEPVQAAVDAWRRIDSREFKNADDDLVQILDLVGLTAEQGVDSKAWPKRRAEKRTSVEFAAKPLGKALAPAFGSAAQGRYRLLMLWERLSDDAIAGVLSQEPGERPIVALYFGAPLPENVRRGVADQLRHQQNRRAVALVDGPAFLYLASKGGRNLATTMRVTLPFSAVNPYTPFVAGSVPLEMFYGRDRELAEIIDPTGTSFIYGGRRLGKSALLRAAERKVNSEGGEHKALYVDLKSKGIGEWSTAEEIVNVISRALQEADVMTVSAAKDPSFEAMRTQVKSWLAVDSGRRILMLLDESDSFLNADAEAGFRNVSELKALMDETGRRFKPVFAGLHQVRRFQRIPNQPLAHLGFPMPVGPLKPQPAYDLITKPLEALGYKFKTSDLPARILTAANYQPSLIQLFCSELVNHMLGKACGPGTPPYPITSRDIEHVYQTPHVVEEMRTRFELTTNLDPRYRVIANAVAFEALEGNLSVGLSASEIRAICDEYWPAGFSGTGSDEFRALLEEMDSLGVLFEDDGNFLMRSPNVLRMLGTAEQIEDHLKASKELEPPRGFEATSFRDSLEGDEYRRRPFTHQQVASLLELQPQPRIVVGSPATSIGDAIPCLEELFLGEPGGYNFKDASSQDPKRLVARFKRPANKKRRVVAYRLKPGSPHETLGLIRKVGEKISGEDTPSTVIFVLGVDALAAWQALIVPEEVGDAAPDGLTQGERFDVIELKRWTKAGLRAWAQVQDVDLFFNEDQSLVELIRATGGWPMLVDRVVSAYTEKRDWRRAIERLEQWLDTPDGARTLCDSIGLSADPGLTDAWNLFMDYDEPIAREEYQALADTDSEGAGRASEVLRSMQVLELDADGRYVVEDTAARAWRKIRSSPPDAAS